MASLNHQMICQICLKTLSSKQNLKQHMNTHTGERPYRCNFPGCECSYRHASQLSNHRILHRQGLRQLKPEFDNLKDFIKLLIEALEPDAPILYSIPNEPYKKTDALLPALLTVKSITQLPSFEKISNISTK